MTTFFLIGDTFIIQTIIRTEYPKVTLSKREREEGVWGRKEKGSQFKLKKES